MENETSLNIIRDSFANRVQVVCENINFAVREKEWSQIQASYGQLTAYLNCLKDIDDNTNEKEMK